MSLLEEVNARVANKNAEMLAERIAAYDKIEGPRSAITSTLPSPSAAATRAGQPAVSASRTIGATGSSRWLWRRHWQLLL